MMVQHITVTIPEDKKEFIRELSKHSISYEFDLLKLIRIRFFDGFILEIVYEFPFIQF